MNFSASFSFIILVYPLKISLSSNKFNVLKTSSVENRGHLISETIGISRIICCFHPLQTDKMIVFMPPTLKKVGSILLSACPSVRPFVRPSVKKN